MVLTGGSIFWGVPGLTIVTQQDRVQMSPAFELRLTYVKISLGGHGKALVGTLKGCSRRGTPWEVRAADGTFWGVKNTKLATFRQNRRFTSSFR